MLANPTGKFEKLITSLQTQKRYEQALQRGEELYQIRQFKVNSLTPYKISEMYYQITSKFYLKKSSNNSQSWFENELRLFIWLLVGYSYTENCDISKMGTSDWEIFSIIFNNRNPDIFQFQALSILKKEVKSQKWSQEEAQLLNSIIQQKRVKNKWNQIAKDLFIRSGKEYFRTAKQCREHWINHLDPSPLRTGWTVEEDFELVQSVLTIGKKWSRISKKFDGKRTEHMVKNRFKSLLHFEQKRINWEKEQVSETRLIQFLLEDLKKSIDNKLNLNLLFSEGYQKQKGLLQLNFNEEIQSAAKGQLEKQKNTFYELKNYEEKQMNNHYQSHLSRIELEDWCLSPKQMREDISLILCPEKEKNFMFEDCISMFMAQDFKKEV